MYSLVIDSQLVSSYNNKESSQNEQQENSHNFQLNHNYNNKTKFKSKFSQYEQFLLNSTTIKTKTTTTKTVLIHDFIKTTLLKMITQQQTVIKNNSFKIIKNQNSHHNSSKNALIISVFLILNLIALANCSQSNHHFRMPSASSSSSAHLNIDHHNSQISGVGVKRVAAASVSTNSHEKIKRDAFIEAFKHKLLKLLDLDEAPTPDQVNITRDQIPEPILQEYNRLMIAQNAKNHNKNNKQTQNADRAVKRISRDMNGVQEAQEHQEAGVVRMNDDDGDFNFDVDLFDNVDLNEDGVDDTIRFNGSVLEQLTLLSKKCK
jgi:hypothetical protein